MMSFCFLHDVFLPIALHRTGNTVCAAKDAMKMLAVKKICHSTFQESNVKYALCWNFGNNEKHGQWHEFIIVSDSAVWKKIGFTMKPGKMSDAFAYSFSKKQNEHGICSVADICLPRDAEHQMKMQIENRLADESVICGPHIIMKPNETFEEALIEIDLAFHFV